MWTGSDTEEDSSDIQLHGPCHGPAVHCAKHQTVNVTKYLVKITQASVSNETLLASLSLLEQMFEQDSDQTVRFAAIESDLLPVLLEQLDEILFSASEEKLLQKSIHKCSVLRWQLCQVSLKLLWHFSGLPIAQQQKLICETVMRRFVSLLDLNNTTIYHYSSKMCKKFHMTVQGKTMYGQVKKQGTSSDLTHRIHSQVGKRCSKTFPNDLPLPEFIYRCVLYDTSDSEKDVNIAESLIEQGLAWSNVKSSSKRKIKPDSEEKFEETEIHVLQTLRGELFWAHVGEMSLYVRTMQLLHSVMSDLSESLPPISGLKQGAEVLVKRLSQGKTSPVFHFYRGLVVTPREDNCDIFAVDMGIMLTSVPVSSVCELPSELNMQDVPPLASLCILDGIQPPAKFPLLPQMAAASLVNLCRYSVPAGEMLVQSLSVLSVLDPLVGCPDQRISCQIIQLLNNLACNSRVYEQIKHSHVIHQLIELLEELVGRRELDEVSMDQSEACLVTLSTLLTISHANRDTFYQRDGLTVVTYLIASNPPMKVYRAAVKLLRIYLWNAPLSSQGATSDRMARVLQNRTGHSDDEGRKPRSQHKSVGGRSRSVARDRVDIRYRSRSVGAVEDRAVHVTLSERRLRGSDSDDEKPSDLFWNKGHNSIPPRRSKSPRNTADLQQLEPTPPPQVPQIDPAVGGTGSEDVTLNLLMSMGVTESQAKEALQATSNNADRAAEWVLKNADMLRGQTEPETSKTIPILPVDSSSEHQNTKYYIVDELVSFEQDALYEIRTNCSIKHASTAAISQVTCGFLNSGKEGRILFGVRPDGRVHGVSLTREERDQFRLGVDRMMVDHLRPVLLHSGFEVKYSPVVRPQGHQDPQTRRPLPDVFVVEICIKSNSGELYTLNNGHCYYRFGPKTVKLNSQDVRQLIVMEEEELCKAEIRKLQSDLATLRRVVMGTSQQ